MLSWGFVLCGLTSVLAYVPIPVRETNVTREYVVSRNFPYWTVVFHSGMKCFAHPRFYIPYRYTVHKLNVKTYASTPDAVSLSNSTASDELRFSKTLVLCNYAAYKIHLASLVASAHDGNYVDSYSQYVSYSLPSWPLKKGWTFFKNVSSLFYISGKFWLMFGGCTSEVSPPLVPCMNRTDFYIYVEGTVDVYAFDVPDSERCTRVPIIPKGSYTALQKAFCPRFVVSGGRDGKSYCCMREQEIKCVQQNWAMYRVESFCPTLRSVIRRNKRSVTRKNCDLSGNICFNSTADGSVITVCARSSLPVESMRVSHTVVIPEISTLMCLSFVAMQRKTYDVAVVVFKDKSTIQFHVTRPERYMVRLCGVDYPHDSWNVRVLGQYGNSPCPSVYTFNPILHYSSSVLTLMIVMVLTLLPLSGFIFVMSLCYMMFPARRKIFVVAISIAIFATFGFLAYHTYFNFNHQLYREPLEDINSTRVKRSIDAASSIKYCSLGTCKDTTVQLTDASAQLSKEFEFVAIDEQKQKGSMVSVSVTGIRKIFRITNIGYYGFMQKSSTSFTVCKSCSGGYSREINPENYREYLQQNQLDAYSYYGGPFVFRQSHDWDRRKCPCFHDQFEGLSELAYGGSGTKLYYGTIDREDTEIDIVVNTKSHANPLTYACVEDGRVVGYYFSNDTCQCVDSCASHVEGIYCTCKDGTRVNCMLSRCTGCFIGRTQYGSQNYESCTYPCRYAKNYYGCLQDIDHQKVTVPVVLEHHSDTFSFGGLVGFQKCSFQTLEKHVVLDGLYVFTASSYSLTLCFSHTDALPVLMDFDTQKEYFCSALTLMYNCVGDDVELNVTATKRVAVLRPCTRIDCLGAENYDYKTVTVTSDFMEVSSTKAVKLELKSDFKTHIGGRKVVTPTGGSHVYLKEWNSNDCDDCASSLFKIQKPSPLVREFTDGVVSFPKEFIGDKKCFDPFPNYYGGYPMSTCLSSADTIASALRANGAIISNRKDTHLYYNVDVEDMPLKLKATFSGKFDSYWFDSDLLVDEVSITPPPCNVKQNELFIMVGFTSQFVYSYAKVVCTTFSRASKTVCGTCSGRGGCVVKLTNYLTTTEQEVLVSFDSQDVYKDSLACKEIIRGLLSPEYVPANSTVIPEEPTYWGISYSGLVLGLGSISVTVILLLALSMMLKFNVNCDLCCCFRRAKKVVMVKTVRRKKLKN